MKFFGQFVKYVCSVYYTGKIFTVLQHYVDIIFQTNVQKCIDIGFGIRTWGSKLSFSICVTKLLQVSSRQTFNLLRDFLE